MNKKLVVLIILVVIILMSLPIVKIILNLFVFEDLDGILTQNLYQNIAPKINDFIKINNRFPNNLEEANIDEKYCAFWKCYKIVYSHDQHNYYLATQANYPWMASYTSDGKTFNSFSLGFVEDYKGSRRDFPIYKKDPKFFATPSAWPKLEESSVFKYIPPFE